MRPEDFISMLAFVELLPKSTLILQMTEMKKDDYGQIGGLEDFVRGKEVFQIRIYPVDEWGLVDWLTRARLAT